ncbi:HTH-type transcriptional regulator LeuO [Kluyvera cryocrescens]|uniref:HTH-type transcriptional regulator LeuO n=1 Tax=Kluyvera cryocrescens TaxID=580 RepID=A0A485CJL6_KLUCR|nr:HTH-type transcriptional regulator LeuO [Kluyvera cryocrescens]
MANLYDLKRFDLNLLVIFECIYQHLSISKAAEMLFITPSAVSQSLQRLRTQLNDPLFVRSGKGITPTTVATNLHQHLSKNLNQLEQTINMMGSVELEKKVCDLRPRAQFYSRLADFMNALLAEPDLQIEYHDFATTQR